MTVYCMHAEALREKKEEMKRDACKDASLGSLQIQLITLLSILGNLRLRT